MTRPAGPAVIALAAVVLVLIAWISFRAGDGDVAPPLQAGAVLLPAESIGSPAGAVSNGALSPVEAAPGRSSATVTTDSNQPPLADGAKWIEVRIVDAATQQPVPQAEVFWFDGSAHKKVADLPELERPALYGDPERIAKRFGWRTRSNAEGLARIATADKWASVHAYADGRYGTRSLNPQGEAPPEGFFLALEADRVLRVQVLDVEGQPAVPVKVAILMFEPDGKQKKNHGWVPPVRTEAPSGLAEWRHIQNWLRPDGGKPQFPVAAWRVVADVPGLDASGVEFDPGAPPSEPIVLRLAATGRLKARVLFQGQPLARDVEFLAYRGAKDDVRTWNATTSVRAADDGWARFAHVALGGSLNVLAMCGSAEIEGPVDAPTGNGQEVSVELSADHIFSLTGRLLGPNGELLTNATAQASIDAEILSGSSVQVKTDALGRFLWMLSKGYIESPRLRRLVLSQTPVEGPPLRASVAPRDLTRGPNDLGDIRLTHGALVVAGRFVFDPPDATMHVSFAVETLADTRTRSGEQRWQEVRNLTPVQRPDGSFEVRGETTPGRHRLMFHAYEHLPVAAVEFPIGTKDLAIDIALGDTLRASCLLPENLPGQLVRGVLRSAGASPPDAADGPLRSTGFDRFTARARNANVSPLALQWMALPAGSYTLEMRTAGVCSPLATTPEVLVPPPPGGDARLKDIDLRGKVATLKLHVVGGGDDEPREQTMVFAQPRDNPQEWEGLQVRDGELVFPVPPGPIDLLVVRQGCQPSRFSGAEHEVTVRLEPWPSLELTFADLPPLPADVTLWANAREQSPVPAQRELRYRTENGSGPLDSWLRPGGQAAEIKSNRATVQVGDGVFRLSLYLRKQDGRRQQALRTFTPMEVYGGRNLAPVAVTVSAEELRTALEALLQPSDGK
ncbi:MAG: hypothetical protein ABIP94_08355 [Planctomycetota bacterium]